MSDNSEKIRLLRQKIGVLEKLVENKEEVISSQNEQIADLMREVFQAREQVRDLEYIYDED